MYFEEAITRAYFPITYMLEVYDCHNLLCVSKNIYNIFHNNGYLKKIILNGSKYNFMELTNQLFSHINYATKMRLIDVKDPHHLPEFTESVKMINCRFNIFNPVRKLDRIVYLDINNEYYFDYSHINCEQIPNIQTFIYTGTNIFLTGIENCKKLKTFILKKHYIANNRDRKESKQIPSSILLSKSIENLITDADMTNTTVISENIKYLVCKGTNININNKNELIYYSCGTPERIEIGRHCLNKKEKDEQQYYRKVSFHNWSVDTFISCASYNLFIDLSI